MLVFHAGASRLCDGLTRRQALSVGGLTALGLERHGFTRERIRKLHHAFKLLLASRLNTSQALEKLKSEGALGEDVELLVRFIETSERGIIK